jgi:hypothetical protein
VDTFGGTRCAIILLMSLRPVKDQTAYSSHVHVSDPATAIGRSGDIETVMIVLGGALGHYSS